MTAALQPLHWLPVMYRIEYRLLTRHCVSRSARSNAGLQRLANHHRTYVSRGALRSANRELLAVAYSNLERYGLRLFSRAGPTQWNA